MVAHSNGKQFVENVNKLAGTLTIACVRSASPPAIRRLRRHELADIWSTDRREVIERVYRLQDGGLEYCHFDVPAWPSGVPEREAPALLDCYVDPRLFELEPNDIHLEFELG